jgi:hypothetical protein
MNYEEPKTLIGLQRGPLSPPPIGLLDAQSCIDEVFRGGRKPVLRTFRNWQAKGWIPVKKIGRFTFFDPNEVRTALDKRFTIKAEIY